MEKKSGIYIDNKLVQTWQQLIDRNYIEVQNGYYGVHIKSARIPECDTLVIDESVATIGPSSFQKTKCNELVLPPLVAIGTLAFSLSNIKKVSSKSNANLPYSCFMDNQNLSEFDFSDVENIGREAFLGCDFKTLFIPNVTVLSGESFFENENLTDVYLDRIELIGKFTDRTDVNIFYNRNREDLNNVIFDEDMEVIFKKKIICKDDPIDFILDQYSLKDANNILKRLDDLKEYEI